MLTISNFIKSLVVMVIFAVGTAQAAPKNKTTKNKFVLSGSELKKLTPADARKYMHSVQKVWVSYEKAFNSKKYAKNKFELPTLIFGFNSAEAAETLWCDTTAKYICYAAAYKSCKGTQSNPGGLCKNQSPCGAGNKGMGCNPALFGKPKDQAQFCIMPDPKTGYDHITESCVAASADSAESNYEFNVSEASAYLDTHGPQIKEFCDTNANASASWNATCGGLIVATGTSRNKVAKPNTAGATTGAAQLENDGSVGTPAPSDQTTKPLAKASEAPDISGTTGSGTASEARIPAEEKRKWCSDSKNFKFDLEKSGLIGRQEDGLKTSTKDGKVEHKIAKGTNCMMCGLRLACGDLVGNKINKDGVAFRQACDDTNKEIQRKFEMFKTNPMNGKGCNNKATKAFAEKWTSLYEYLNKGGVLGRNKENAKNMQNDVVDFYLKGRAAGLFCSSKADQIDPDNNNWKDAWGNEDFSPIVAVPAYTGYQRSNKSSSQKEYQESIVNTFNLGAFANKGDKSAAEAAGSEAIDFLCDRTQQLSEFGTIKQAPAINTNEDDPAIPGQTED